MASDYLAVLLGIGAVAAPLFLLTALGLLSLFDKPLSERTTAHLVAATNLTGLVCALSILILMVTRRSAHLEIDLGNWIALEDYHLSIKLLFDTLSLSFLVLAYVICGVIGVFANRYLHREPSYNRFFVLYALFTAGMAMTALAGTIELLFFGWELIGLSSAFLVAFFQERLMPVRNGLHVWIVYRVSDAAFLAALIVMHHLRGQGDLTTLLGTEPWPQGVAAMDADQAFWVGGLLLVAAAGKSALIPFSGWLPRAMEGPTPSSAVFYGAISVHLGAFLLLRISPILELSPALAWSVTALGLATAGYATLVGRAATDIKTALSFASLTQVGIIVAEIGLGLRYVALAHLIGHGCLRTLQFLRAPTLLHDYHTIENAIGHHLPSTSRRLSAFLPEAFRVWAYRFALERGYLDLLLKEYLVRPFLAFFLWCDRLEQRWTDFLARGPSRESGHLHRAPESLDDLA
jgi:NADH-quinone oxidoreductase subunit L